MSQGQQTNPLTSIKALVRITLMDEAKGNVKVLIIKKTQQEDTGLYTVIATNEAGEDSCSANLSVKGKKDTAFDSKSSLAFGQNEHIFISKISLYSSSNF